VPPGGDAAIAVIIAERGLDYLYDAVAKEPGVYLPARRSAPGSAEETRVNGGLPEEAEVSVPHEIGDPTRSCQYLTPEAFPTIYAPGQVASGVKDDGNPTTYEIAQPASSCNREDDLWDTALTSEDERRYGKPGNQAEVTAYRSLDEDIRDRIRAANEYNVHPQEEEDMLVKSGLVSSPASSYYVDSAPRLAGGSVANNKLSCSIANTQNALGKSAVVSRPAGDDNNSCPDEHMELAGERGATAADAVEWECATCSNLNAADRSRCVMCKESLAKLSVTLAVFGCLAKVADESECACASSPRIDMIIPNEHPDEKPSNAAIAIERASVVNKPFVGAPTEHEQDCGIAGVTAYFRHVLRSEQAAQICRKIQSSVPVTLINRYEGLSVDNEPCSAASPGGQENTTAGTPFSENLSQSFKEKRSRKRRKARPVLAGEPNTIREQKTLPSQDNAWGGVAYW